MTTDGLDISMGWRMFRKYVLDPLRRLFTPVRNRTR
jgi:hypothetical protein